MLRSLFGNRKLLLVALIVVLAAGAATTGWRSGENPGMLDRAVMILTVPVVKGAVNTAGLFTDGGILTNWKALREENRRLRSEIARLQREAEEWREREGAYRRLAEMLEYRETTGHPMTVAAVIGNDSTNLFRTILINKGTRDGLLHNMAVVTPEGVVGRTIKVFDTTSRVLLLTDRSLGIDALVQRTRDQGVVQGRGIGECEMKYLSRQSAVSAGDVIVTSGMGGVFPKGVRIGKVTSVKKGGYLLQKVEVEPSAALDRLEEVIVLTGQEASR